MNILQRVIHQSSCIIHKIVGSEVHKIFMVLIWDEWSCEKKTMEKRKKGYGHLITFEFWSQPQSWIAILTKTDLLHLISVYLQSGLMQGWRSLLTITSLLAGTWPSHLNSPSPNKYMTTIDKVHLESVNILGTVGTNYSWWIYIYIYIYIST